MGLRNLEDNSRIQRKNSDLSYREGRTAWSTVEPFLQVRFHRNIAASSLAADCNIPQRPPAFLISNKLKVSLKTVCHNGVHTHTQLENGLKLDVPHSGWSGFERRQESQRMSETRKMHQLNYGKYLKNDVDGTNKLLRMVQRISKGFVSGSVFVAVS